MLDGGLPIDNNRNLAVERDNVHVTSVEHYYCALITLITEQEEAVGSGVFNFDHSQQLHSRR